MQQTPARHLLVRRGHLQLYRLGQVVAVQVHDLGPGRDEVAGELRFSMISNVFGAVNGIVDLYEHIFNFDLKYNTQMPKLNHGDSAAPCLDIFYVLTGSAYNVC
ncbi:MAG: hypothetical protein AAFY02_14275 [Pseudomonadota bacterium]